VKKFVFPENRSVNDLSVMGGTIGDDAIEPGAPPVCPGGTGFPDAPILPLPRLLFFFVDEAIVVYNIRDFYFSID
jgi:hypothetical protein